jgi:hypothetical protein
MTPPRLAYPDVADQENDQDGLVSGQADVGGSAKDGEDPQVWVPGDEPDAVADFLPQRARPAIQATAALPHPDCE